VNAVVRMLIVICACAGGYAVAAGSDPNAVEPDQSVSQPSANKPTKIVLRDETLDGAQLKQILAKGYKPEGHGDQVLYCRRESEMGTRVETKVCRTATVILGLEQQGRDITERAQKDNGNPTLH
jgi:hypothetical protein